ncbi:hypothetical protein JMUB7516_27480 [Staphylococcus aureus]
MYKRQEGSSSKLEIKPQGTESTLQGTQGCLLYTSPSPRDYAASRMPSSA